MPIGNFTQIARQTTTSDMVLGQQDEHIGLRKPLNPPGAWTRFKAALSSVPLLGQNGDLQRARQKVDSYPVRLEQYQASNRQILAGFVQDMQQTYGENVANMAMRDMNVRDGAPLSQRKLRTVLHNVPKVQKQLQATNNARLFAFLKSPLQSAYRMQGGSDMNGVFRARNMPLPTTWNRTLSLESSRFIARLTAEICRAQPGFSTQLLSNAQIVAAANEALDLYQSLLATPGMTPAKLDGILMQANLQAHLGAQEMTDRARDLVASDWLEAPLDRGNPESMLNQTARQVLAGLRDEGCDLESLPGFTLEPLLKSIRVGITESVSMGVSDLAKRLGCANDMPAILETLDQVVPQKIEAAIREHVQALAMIEASTRLTEDQKAGLREIAGTRRIDTVQVTAYETMARTISEATAALHAFTEGHGPAPLLQLERVLAGIETAYEEMRGKSGTLMDHSSLDGSDTLLKLIDQFIDVAVRGMTAEQAQELLSSMVEGDRLGTLAQAMRDDDASLRMQGTRTHVLKPLVYALAERAGKTPQEAKALVDGLSTVVPDPVLKNSLLDAMKSIEMPDTSEELRGDPQVGLNVGQLDGPGVRIVDQLDSELVIEVLQPPGQEPPRQQFAPQAQLVATPPEARELARETLPDRDALIERIGAPPRRDIAVGSLMLGKMSTGYKDVLDKLDDYHAALARCNEPQDWDAPDVDGHNGAKREQVLRLLDLGEALEALEQSLQAYETGDRHTHKDAMRTLLAQVREEQGVIDGALRQLDEREGRPNVALNDAIGFLRIHPELSLAEIDTLVDQGWSVTDYGAMWQMTLEPHGLRESDVREAVRLGHDLDTVRAYHEARLPITEQTQPGAKIDSELSPLGQGMFNSVYKGEVTLDDGATHMTGVFKAEDPSTGALSEAGGKAGIDTERPNWTMRNVATYKLDQRLGLGVIPRTEIALHQGQVGNVMELVKGVSPQTKGNFSITLPPEIAEYLQEHPETVQAYVKSKGFASGTLDGNTLKVTNERLGYGIDKYGELIYGDDGQPKLVPTDLFGLVSTDFGDPVLRRDLTRLQWLDTLTGQVDRHGQNYFVEYADDGQTIAGIKGIDNDIAFGGSLTNARDTSNRGFCMSLNRLQEFDFGFKGCSLPQVIDRKTFDALMALTPEQIDADCAGLLNADEIKATQSRLAGIQEHLQTLDDAGRVLDEDADWGSDEVAKLLGMEYGPFEAHSQVIQSETSTLRDKQRSLDSVANLESQARDVSYVARDWMMQERTRLQNLEGRGAPLLDLGQLTPPGELGKLHQTDNR